MRHLLLLGFVLAALNGNAVQVNGPGSIEITIAPSQIPGGSAAVIVWGNEPYVNGPFAGVGAQAATGTQVSGLSFAIRAWKENDKSRVVVYAVLDDKRAPSGRTETPINTFTIAPGQTVEIPETERWGAARVAVTATVRNRKDAPQ